MSVHNIFVFPSFCEGSARVIFEAMAVGCFIITTPNSGSIVKDGVHGSIVPAGDHRALALAIDYALSNPQIVGEIGLRNAFLVRTKYRQSDYVAKVVSIYQEVLQNFVC